MALQILERREDFPGVTAELDAVRDYPQPLGANAAHELGYLGPVTDDELKARAQNAHRGATNETVLQRTDLIGRTGLEREYDDDLRGRPGVKTLAVDHQGGVSGVLSETQPTAGTYLVTSIDAKVQAAAEKQLKAAIMRARHTGDINKGSPSTRPTPARSSSWTCSTGGIVAMASYPTYDPNVWVGGISSKDYKSHHQQEAQLPATVPRHPGRVRARLDVQGGLDAGRGQGRLPAARHLPLPVGVPDRRAAEGNFESEAFGDICFSRAIEVSCDTVFYKFAYEEWQRDGGMHPKKNPKDPFIKMAKAFGLGTATGIDLPSEVDRPDRRPGGSRTTGRPTRTSTARKAKTGYPEVAKTDPQRAAYLQQIAKENCVDG